MAVRLQASKLKNDKGKAKPLDSETIISMGNDLSYLPFATTVLRSSLCNLPLEIDTEVPLEPIRYWRCQAFPRLKLRDEDEEGAKGSDGATLGLQKRKRR